MMNVIRRKPSATEKLNAHAAPGNASRNQATPPTLDVSGIDHNREGMGIRAANVLPDLRLSGFDFDKIMGQAGLGFPSPLGTTDNKDIGPIRPGDYITNNASIPGKCTSHLPPPSSNQSIATVASSASSSFQQTSKPKQQQMHPSTSTPQLRHPRDYYRPPMAQEPSIYAHRGSDSTRCATVGISNYVSTVASTYNTTRSEHYSHSARRNTPEPAHPADRSHAPPSPNKRPLLPPQVASSSSSRLSPHTPGHGLMSKIGRALKMESEGERKAREWEEALERQNQSDRHERNKRKALQAVEEAKRKKAEEEERSRRGAAAERIEREHREHCERQAEVEKFRSEQRQREEDILRKHEEERRRQFAEEKARIDRIIAEKRREEEAEIARKRKAEELERRKKRREEEAERARLQATEDEKRAVEEAKQKYFQAVAQARASVERDDFEHLRSSKYAAEAHARHIQELKSSQECPSDVDSREHPASDSGISIQSSDPSVQQAHQTNIASLEQSSSLIRESSTMAPRLQCCDDAGTPYQVAGCIQHFASRGGNLSSCDAGSVPQGRSVHFYESPKLETMSHPRERLTVVRFASALSVGARSAAIGKSPLVLEPAVRVPWNAVALPSSQSTPHFLALVAYQVALAETSNPTKPVQGEGWRSHGIGHPDKIPPHYRVIEVPSIRLAGRKVELPARDEADELNCAKASDDAESVNEEVWEEYTQEVLHFDLFERVFTRTTPDVLERLVANLDCADVKSLRQSCKEVRFALDHLGGREIVLRRFLDIVGYRTWKRIGTADKDPLPLGFSDVEAFILSSDVYTEYQQVAVNWLRSPQEMDARIPRLARASTRAYSRLLSRLRAQPGYVVPQSAGPMNPPMVNLRCPAMWHSTGEPQSGVHSPNPAFGSALVSPWKPGRAALFRVWVPTKNSIWQTDDEVVRCERELFLAGVWSFLQRGDIVWNVAMGDENNVGRMIFDGRYLRDLAFRFDKAGHLPSWQNMFLYSPSYYHNIIRSSTTNPIIYLDILPWREEIVSSLRLVQDRVETTNASGGRYRIAKWLYRAVAHVQAGQIISDEGLVVADEGWEGRIVFETEGITEHAKDFVARCAGPLASSQAKAHLLASVLGGTEGTAATERSPNEISVLKRPAVKDAQGRKVETQTPFAVLRERSRPGLIWLRPVMPRESLEQMCGAGPASALQTPLANKSRPRLKS